MEISALRHPPVWLALDSRQLGGLESTLLHLAPLLDARGVLVEVVLISRTVKTRPLVRALQQAGIRCHLAADSLDFFQLLHHQRPCLLHCMGQRASLLGRVLGQWLGIPVVTTRRGPGSTANPPMGQRLLARLAGGQSRDLPASQLPATGEELLHLLHIYQQCLGETLLPQVLDSEPPRPTQQT